MLKFNIGSLEESALLAQLYIQRGNRDDDSCDVISANIRHLMVSIDREDVIPLLTLEQQENYRNIINQGKVFLLTPNI